MLYKYIPGCWAQETLTDARLKVSHPKEFNDPFECLPRTDVQPSDQKIDKKLNDPQTLAFWQAAYQKTNGVSGSPQKVMNLLNNNHEFYRTFIRNYKRSPEYCRDTLCSHVRVVCFSREKTDILMWAHYADKHRGVLIGFDEDQISPKEYLHEVQYKDQRNKFHIVDVVGSGDEWILPHLTIKSRHWRYEAEVRLLAPLVKTVESDGLNFWHFPPAAVKEIIFGAQCETPEKTSIQAILSSSYTHVAQSQMRLHDTDFALIEESI